MRRNRIFYGVTLIGVMTLCYHYQTYWTSLMGYIALLLPMMSFLYTLRIYSLFTYTQTLDKKFVTKGEDVVFAFGIYNDGALFYPDVEIIFYGEDTILGKHFEKRRVSVDGRGNKSYDYKVTCHYRGYYQLGIEKVYLYDFLGLFRLPYRVFEPKYITVYPRIIDLQYFPISRHTLEESEAIKQAYQSDGMVLSDIRAYRYGDSMRKIHWKMTAKKGSLMVRNTNATVKGAVDVLLDLRKQEGSIEEQALLEDCMVECALAVLYYGVKQGLSARLVTYHGEPQYWTVENTGQFEAVYHYLYKVNFKEARTLAEVISVGGISENGGRSRVIITGEMTMALYEHLDRWALDSREVVVIYVGYKEEEASIEQQQMLEALRRQGIRVIPITEEDNLKNRLENECEKDG
ncbi:MAG: DUF58 domain-containing protein [Cellulosilyticaceae bacterium]